jgi:DNA-binding transcriptional ArsR family regulator
MEIDMTRNNVGAIVGQLSCEILAPMKLLSDDTRLAIVLSLLKNGTMTFSQLSDVTGVRPSSLSHHLSALTRSALVKNYYAKSNNSDDYSFYETTPLVRDFVEGVLGLTSGRASLTDIINNLARADREYDENIAELFKSIGEYKTEIQSLSTLGDMSGAIQIDRARRVKVAIPS